MYMFRDLGGSISGPLSLIRLCVCIHLYEARIITPIYALVRRRCDDHVSTQLYLLVCNVGTYSPTRRVQHAARTKLRRRMIVRVVYARKIVQLSCNDFLRII